MVISRRRQAIGREKSRKEGVRGEIEDPRLGDNISDTNELHWPPCSSEADETRSLQILPRRAGTVEFGGPGNGSSEPASLGCGPLVV
jgi:hypothetical protein